MKYNTPFRGYPGSNFCTIIAASLACRLVLSLRESDEARGWSTGTASASGVISHTSSDRSSRTKIGSKISNKLGGGGSGVGVGSRTGTAAEVQISTQTMQAYCSDSSGTVHLTSFPGDEKDAGESSLELNELEKKDSIADAKREFDVEKGRM